MEYLFLTLMNENELNAINSKFLPIVAEVSKRSRLEQLEGEKIKLMEDVIKKFLELQKEIEQLRADLGQECKKCNSFWSTSKKVDKCPFCGENLNGDPVLKEGWVLTDDGVLTVASIDSSEISEKEKNRKAEWNKAKKLILCEGITQITREYFCKLGNLEEVKFPMSLKKIGFASFQECKRLKAIEIPDGVTTISANAFYKCSSLEKVIIPASVKYIGNDAFFECGAQRINVAEDCAVCTGNFKVYKTIPIKKKR